MPRHGGPVRPTPSLKSLYVCPIIRGLGGFHASDSQTSAEFYASIKEARHLKNIAALQAPERSQKRYWSAIEKEKQFRTSICKLT
jgi:hypothetical protein